MDRSIGQKLRSARLEKELSLDQVSKELHIRAAYLKALEDENFQALPSPVQVKGFLKSYADFLHLQVDYSPKSAGEELSVGEKDQNGNFPENLQSESAQKLSVTIFQEIGAELRERREVLGLSKLDIEAHTHIPEHYIEYIESGTFDNFPSPTQARGMLVNYINFLNIDPDRPMLKYAEALQSELSVRQANLKEESDRPKFFSSLPKPRLSQPPQWVRMFFSPDLILVGVLGITIITMTIWGIGRVNRARTELVPQPTAPSLVEALLPSHTVSPTPTTTIQADASGELLNVDSQPENTPIPFGESEFSTSMQVFIIIRQRTFLKVTIDGEVAYDGRALPGASFAFYGQESIELLTGDAGALQVYFNDQDQGVLGISGEAKKIIYTQDGVFIPTALPTATFSPEQLITPSPTSTPNDNPALPPAENTPIP